MTPLEANLRRLVAALDDTALAALASQGLLRRAYKDHERGQEEQLLGEADGRLQVRVGDFTVSLPSSGPAAARCSCPAAGICQHILGAVLFLKTSPAEAEQTVPVPAAGDDAEWLAFSPAQLETWAGRPAFRAGVAIAAGEAGEAAEIDRVNGLRVRCPALNRECHFVAGGGLEGVIVTAGRHDPRALVVAAVIALQRAAGVPWELTAPTEVLAASAGAPRSRAEVLWNAGALLAEMLAAGLARVSPAMQQRWATLAVSALGVQLPRLALAARGLADEVALAVTRDARADLGRLLQRMAHTQALVAALRAGGENPRADLVGQHRTRYDEVGHLQLHGVAAWPWRTASGYEGLTLLFWDPAAGRWNTWSEARPRHQQDGFNPFSRFSQPGPWEGAASPQQVAGSAFRLLRARRNPVFRLSGSTRSRALVTAPSLGVPAGLAPADRWAELPARLARQRSRGLREGDPLAAVVALQPHRWGAVAFDPVTQLLRWPVADLDGVPAELRLAFSDLTEPAIRTLEMLSPAATWGATVIGRAELIAGKLILQPFSLLRPGKPPLHLAFAQAGATAASPGPAASPGQASADPELDPVEPDEDSTEPLTSFRLLDELEDQLLALAERGVPNGSGPVFDRLSQLGHAAAQLGLTTLAGQLRRLVAKPDSPEWLLRAIWTGRLHRELAPQ